jgi:CRP-like cAMP-binding protein
MARSNPFVDRLGELDLFRRCSKKDLESVAAIVEELEVEPGTVLCEQGRMADACYVVVDGLADVVVGGEIVGRASVGRPIGEMALLDHLPRSATVTARTPMHLLKLDAHRFEEMLRTQPAVARGLLEHLSRTVRDLQSGRGSVSI